jgi:hypothetical protein
MRTCLFTELPREAVYNDAAVLTLGEEGQTKVFRRDAGEGNLEGILWEVALGIRTRRREARREHALPE